MARNRRKPGGREAKNPDRPLPVGAIEADEDVDLHGLAVDEAMVQAEMALERHCRRPGSVLRFIHGHSTGISGSIKGALRRNLETVWKGRIRSFRPEPGNPGTTLVKLA